MTAEPYDVDRDVIVKKIRAFKARQPIGDLYFAVVDFKLKRFPADLNRRDSQRARVERVFGH